MKPMERSLRVLARFPNLNSEGGHRSRSASSKEFWSETRRIIGETLSLRMLSLLFVVMVLSAIIPFSAIWRGDEPEAASLAASPKPPDVSIPPAEVTGAATATPFVARSSPTFSEDPAMAGRAAPSAANDDQFAQVSAWPNPASSQAWLTADARANGIAPAQATTRESTTQPSANQGYYDHTRSSVY